MTKYQKYLITHEKTILARNGAFAPPVSSVNTLITATVSTTTLDAIQDILSGHVGVNPAGLEVTQTYYVAFNTAAGVLATGIEGFSISGLTYSYATTGNFAAPRLTGTLATNSSIRLLPGVTLVSNSVNITIVFENYRMPFNTFIDFRRDTADQFTYALNKVSKHTNK